jgi:hypothetical protein
MLKHPEQGCFFDGGNSVARDDFFVVMFKVLTYLYGCLKGKIVFQKDIFLKTIGNEHLADGVLDRYLEMISDNGYIRGLEFVQAWCGETIRTGDYSNMQITMEGIQYLQENSTMQKIEDFLLVNAEALISSLIVKVFDASS